MLVSSPVLSFWTPQYSVKWQQGVICEQLFDGWYPWLRVSQVAPMEKNLPANAGDTGDVGSTPGSRRSPGGGHCNPLQYSCLDNPQDRGDWQAMVHRVAESDMTEAT